MSHWTDVEEAVAAHAEAYGAMIRARRDEREGSKKGKEAHDAWLEAHAARREALAAHWFAADGLLGDGLPRLGPVLQRFYAEMEPVWKAREEARAEAAKAKKKKEAKDA